MENAFYNHNYRKHFWFRKADGRAKPVKSPTLIKAGAMAWPAVNRKKSRGLDKIMRKPKTELEFTYNEAVRYIEELPKFTKKNPIAHTGLFLEKLEIREENMKILHVAGTNGKGSVCAMLSEILTRAGKRTGLFTSPHLVEMRERIRLNGQPVPQEQFVEVFGQVVSMVRRMEADGVPHPSYFEFLFLMGMCAFSREKAEYVILETGLGGRLDATNVIKKPVVSVITSIGMDHMEYLGNTIRQIAGEKAGIIKEGVPVVFWGEDPVVAEVMTDQAKAKNTRWVCLTKKDCQIEKKTDKSIDFSIRNGYYFNNTFRIPFMAEYPVQNALLALTALREAAPDIAGDYDFVSQALACVRWEGRMEKVCPGLILDGAHNGPGIDEFVKTFCEYRSVWEGQAGVKNILFSVVKDKDYDYMVQKIAGTDVSKVYITHIPSERGLDTGKILTDFRENGCQAEIAVFEEIGDALTHAMHEKKQQDTLFCVGSLYLIGEIKKWLQKHDFK